jgi:hypothetical protein
MKEIIIKAPYTFFDTVLLGGARYKIGSMPGGHELTEERARKLIDEELAEEVR